MTVQRFSNGPTVPLGIPEDNVSSYRFVIKAGGDLTVGDGTEVRLDVSTLDGIDDASNVTVLQALGARTGAVRCAQHLA